MSDHNSRRFTRSELREAVAHDHTYCMPTTQLQIVSSLVVTPLNSCLSIPLCATPQTETRLVACSRFSIEQISSDDKAVQFYTSFPSHSCFMICFRFLGDAVNHLVYPGSSNETTSNRFRCQRSLTPINEFFLTLCRLRCGLMEQDLAYRFHVSQATVSRICIAWINFLYCKLSEIPIWPSRAQVQSLMPPQFKEQYPNTRIIIDATEVYIQKPSNPHAQLLTFSSYKNHNTAKALAGITPSGALSFISPLYGGSISISDRELVIQSGLINKLEMGDAIMADKGFSIADLLEHRKISLNIPPRKTSNQFDNDEMIETRRIASLRIHIERAFSRVKSFKILNNIPNNMAGLSSEIFYTCALLTNFQPPLISPAKEIN